MHARENFAENAACVATHLIKVRLQSAVQTVVGLMLLLHVSIASVRHIIEALARGQAR